MLCQDVVIQHFANGDAGCAARGRTEKRAHDGTGKGTCWPGNNAKGGSQLGSGEGPRCAPSGACDSAQRRADLLAVAVRDDMV